MKNLAVITFVYMFFLMLGCQEGNKQEGEPNVSTPVSVTTIKSGNIPRIIKLMATSSYLRKNTVRSTSTGYITLTNCIIGDYANLNKPLFKIRTKEAEALGSFNKLNPGFSFSGDVTLLSPTSGILTEVNKQVNDYVSDGDPLCTIAEQSSLVFLLNVPFEQNKQIKPGAKCEVLLPDSTIIKGVINSKLSGIDPVSQTQNFIIKPATSLIIPENLNTYVLIKEEKKTDCQIIDKKCVLSNETLDNFWVMKLINDSTAVRVDVKTGVANEQNIEIISPVFDLKDRLISTGHYGLPDTAKVNIRGLQIELK